MADPVRIFAVTGDAVAHFVLGNPDFELALEGCQARCIAVVYAGTEPSNLYRSEDGGLSWQPLPDLVIDMAAATA